MLVVAAVVVMMIKVILDVKELIIYFKQNSRMRRLKQCDCSFLSYLPCIITMLSWLSPRLALHKGGINVWFNTLFLIAPGIVLELCFHIQHKVRGPVQEPGIQW